MPWHVDVDSIESVLLMEGDALIMLKSNNAYFVVESPEEVLTKISAAQAACRAQEK